MTFSDRLVHAWNAFIGRDPTLSYKEVGVGYSYRPDKRKYRYGNESTLINSIITRIALDCSAIRVEHVMLDEDDRYLETVEDHFNECLTTEANIDQTGRAFIQDLVHSMLEEGVVAAVPVETTENIMKTGSYDILQLRTAKVVQWYPEYVRLRLYNQAKGMQEELTLPKSSVAIIENPFYTIMNEPNSTLRRLVRKLNLLDGIDEQVGAGKLDLIIQLPYVIKTEERRKQADDRKANIEQQLRDSKYGIAYTDSTEHITQLNRPLENNLLKQIEYMTDLLYSQLGMTTGILDGTADDKAMNNYYNRIVEPIMSAIVDEFRRKFLTKTARTQNHDVKFFRDPFKLMPISEVSDFADKFTRNEIMTSNEIRQAIGMKPANDPTADELRNKNISMAKDQQHFDKDGNPIGELNQNGVENPETGVEAGMSNDDLISMYQDQLAQLDDFDSQLNELESSLGNGEEYVDEKKRRNIPLR